MRDVFAERNYSLHPACKYIEALLVSSKETLYVLQ